jgi:hypothetical protein
MMGQGLTPYGGAIVPQASPLQQASFGGAAGLTPLATGAMGFGQQGLEVADPSDVVPRAMGMAQQGMERFMQPFDPSIAIQAMEPAKQFGMQMFKDDIVPWIMEKYGAGLGAKESGAMGRIMGREGSRLAGGLSAQLAQNIFPAWQSHLGRQQTGVGQAMQMAGLPGQIAGQAGQVGGMGADLLGQLMNIGGQQRGISGELLQEPYQKWQYSQPYNNPYMSNFLPMALGQPPKEIVTQEQGPGLGGYGMGALGSFLGTEAGAGMMSALLLCDERLKENFAPIVDALEKLQKIDGKTYNFKGEDKRSAGVIAQDVEKVLPEAVIEQEGIKLIRPDALIGLIINGIREVNEKVDYALFEARRAF